jgi:adenosylmethionine---8-amino-7-oxononanoate aminotransferase
MTSRLPKGWDERIAFDLEHVWHPFTQMKVHERVPPVAIVRGEGCDLVLADGRRVLDAVSSWWTNVHGHGHPRIAGAIAEQASRLDHAMFAGFTHEPALELVARLLPRLPPGLTRVFFSDDGSTSVEVALKMAFQAQHQRGEERPRIGALHGAYHGDTLGAVGVGELANFMTRIFQPLLLRCERLEVPEDTRCLVLGGDREALQIAIDEARARIARFFEEHGASLAAFIVEPLVQGAGGMRMWPPELLVALREACSAHRVVFIADEVMTGFGRTGTFFACERAGVTPDILCSSKGLTGGALPLAVTCASEEIYAAFWGEQDKAFLHGHSFTANPIACAAAAANLALFDEEPILDRAAALATHLRKAWTRIAAHPAVRDARTLGTIAACRLIDPRTGHASDEPLGLSLHRRALDRGALVRPIGDCLYVLPPLATSLDRIDALVDIVLASL